MIFNIDEVLKSGIKELLARKSFQSREKVLSSMANKGRLRLEEVNLFRLQVYERVMICLVEVYERGGRSAIPVCKKTQKD